MKCLDMSFNFRFNEKWKRSEKRTTFSVKFIFKNLLYKIEIDISGSWTDGSFDFKSRIRQWAMTFNNDAITTCPNQKSESYINRVEWTQIWKLLSPFKRSIYGIAGQRDIYNATVVIWRFCVINLSIASQKGGEKATNKITANVHMWSICIQWTTLY